MGRLFDGMMRRLLKKIAEPLLIPLTRWYLRKPRVYQKHGMSLVVEPGVFHPGLFSSSAILYEYLIQQPIAGKRLLDLGCGTGFIAIAAAQRGAIVTACDISRQALQNTRKNVERANVSVSILHSDVFGSLRPEPYDWIVVNPPYYAQDPVSEAEYAWKCGSNHRYFSLFFGTLRIYLSPSTQVIMVLTKGCDLNRIFAIARENNFTFELILEKNVLFDEKDYLYRIKNMLPSTASIPA